MEIKWFHYENTDLYNSYNVVFGDEEDMTSWTETLECQTEAQGRKIAEILNTIEAGPYQDTSTVHAKWQTALREGRGDIRKKYLGVSELKEKSKIR